MEKAVLDKLVTNYIGDSKIKNREQLEGMVKASLSPMSIMDVEYNLDTVSGVKRICEKYNCEAEDLELLGYKIPDEYWEGDE